MYPLGLGVVSWWWIAILATAVFWAVLVPGMPTREYRIRMIVAPFIGAIAACGYHYAGHKDTAMLLVMYTSIALAVPLGMIGHRRKLAQKLMEAKRQGVPEEEVVLPGMLAQLSASLVVFGVACFWIVW